MLYLSCRIRKEQALTEPENMVVQLRDELDCVWTKAKCNRTLGEHQFAQRMQQMKRKFPEILPVNPEQQFRRRT